MPRAYVELNGGLANQLFQWAAACSVQHAVTGVDVIVDDRIARRPSERGDELARLGLGGERVRHNPWADLLWSALARCPRAARDYLTATVRSPPPAPDVVVAASLETCRQALEAGRDVWLRGFFQSEQAVRAWGGQVRTDVLAALSARAPLPAAVTDLGEYTAMHLRRGDYVANPRNQTSLGPCSVAYYVRAAGHLDPTCPLVLVSDDPPWCEALLAPRLSREVVVLRGGSAAGDLRVLAGARQVALSNSTFSWWGAYLAAPSRVVAPRPWFDDPQLAGSDLSWIADVVLDKLTGDRLGT